MESVITRVKLEEIPDQDGKFTIPKKHLKKTVKLLKEAMAAERGEELEGKDSMCDFLVCVCVCV